MIFMSVPSIVTIDFKDGVVSVPFIKLDIGSSRKKVTYT